MVQYAFTDLFGKKCGKFLGNQAEQSSAYSADKTTNDDSRYIGEKRQGFVGISEIGIISDNGKRNEAGQNDSKQCGAVCVEHVLFCQFFHGKHDARYGSVECGGDPGCSAGQYQHASLFCGSDRSVTIETVHDRRTDLDHRAFVTDGRSHDQPAHQGDDLADDDSDR